MVQRAASADADPGTVSGSRQSAVVTAAFGRRHLCGDCEVQGRCVGRDLTDAEQQVVGQLEVTSHLLRRGEHVYRSGDRFESLHVVKSGVVKTYVISESGEEQVTGFHGPGSVVGFDAIAGGVHHCGAVALDTTCACTVSFPALLELCSRSRAMQRRVLGWMSGEIVRDQTLMMLLAKKNAEQRMAAFLLDQCAQLRRRGLREDELDLPMSRADIGSFLGLAVETVSRVLTRFQEGGIIEVRRACIGIRERDGLRRLAEDAPGERTARAG